MGGSDESLWFDKKIAQNFYASLKTRKFFNYSLSNLRLTKNILKIELPA